MTTSPRIGFTSSPEVEIADVAVSGTIPDWVHGTLLRNGPGTFQVGEQRYRHWFDGLAMLHRFTIEAGRVSYANRFLDTHAYREAQETGRIQYSEFATDPCRSLFARAMAVFEPTVTDSAKVNIAKLADRFLALAETPIQVEFDPVTLETVGVTGWDSGTFARMTTVHPHIDVARDETYNLVTRFGARSAYCLKRASTRGDLEQSDLLGMLRVGQPSYIHSFGMSEHHLVVVEFPLIVNPMALLLWLRPYIENFRWKPERGTRFHVFDRRTGQLIRSVRTRPFFAFHHVNAFERDGELVVDMVAYEDNSIIDAFYLHRLEDPDLTMPAGHLRRFTVPLHDGEVREQQIGSSPIELPSFDYGNYNTRPDNRYVYGISLTGAKGFYDQLVKIDLTDGREQTWHEAGCFPGEAVFVSRPGGSEQDDGVLLSVVLDAERGSSFLLVLDAHTMEEQARATLEHPILFGYHGIFT